ncbi:MAG: Trehalose synthase [Vampirovibrio sp.]|jgi:maltose alpha-D-glucosyltransferase/alpha-amylase|nr:Trehalose synthase [Vampirovibrio sp.]
MRFPNKKVLSLSLAVEMLFQLVWQASPFQAQALAQPPATLQATSPVEIPQTLATNIRESISAVYGPARADEIYNQVMARIQKARQQRPAALLDQDLSRPADWYKDEVIYMVYADRFGMKAGKKTTTFRDLIGTLDYLQQLGVTTLYILPFMDSPMGDAGFDVRNFKSVRSDLGGLSEFQSFALEARKRGFKLKSDLILNHVSDQHAWFQAALKGDKSKLNYFVMTDKKPVYKKYNDPQKGIVVDYQEDDGKISSRSVVFPDMSDTQYREVTIQGKKYYFYHTFYPFQMDINWGNPQVLYEMLDVISFWANQGIDIFRLDAVPYLIKPKGTNGENQPETLALIKLISAYLEATAPSSVLQAEAGQKLRDLLPYFGEEQVTVLNIQGQPKPISRTNRVQIAYNFPYMSAIWASLITHDNKHFWQVAEDTPQLPDSATWATFLRVHDELTLQMVDPVTRAIVADNLEPKGAEFRKGWGVSGRMANFLDQNPARIKQAFSIMMSLPGIPIIYYGDEIGEVNDFNFAKQYAAQREATQKKNNPNLDIISFYDSRDVNRGPLPKSRLDKAVQDSDSHSSELFSAVHRLIETRKTSQALRRGSLVGVPTDQPSVLAYLREFGSENILMLHNLSDQPNEVSVSLPSAYSAILGNIGHSTGKLTSLDTQEAIPYQRNGDKLLFKLEPYQSLWLGYAASITQEIPSSLPQRQPALTP